MIKYDFDIYSTMGKYQQLNADWMLSMKRKKTEIGGVMTAQAPLLQDTSCWVLAMKNYFQDNSIKPGIAWKVSIEEYRAAAVIKL